MAISPLVQKYQMQAQQQQSSSSEQETYDKKFGEAAYDVFKAKYPSLLEYIVTFKVIESDVEEETGVAAFIVTQGNKVVYIPVILSGGKVESCEMLYDKQEDTFMPLIEEVVSRLKNSNQLTDFSIVNKIPHTEDTRELFKRIVRPPSSSNPVLAGDRNSVESLPNGTKEKIATYLKENTKLFSKIAAFYPVDKLAEKLASIPEQEKPISENIPSVISIDELTKEAAEALTKDQKDSILKDGYLIQKEASESPEVLSTKNLARDMVTSLQLTEIKPGNEKYGTGYLLHLKDGDVVGEKCLIAADKVFTQSGFVSLAKFTVARLVIAGFNDNLELSDLVEFGSLYPGQVRFQGTDVEEEGQGIPPTNCTEIFYPTKNNTYKKVDFFNLCMNFEKRVLGNDVYFVNRFEESENVFTDSIEFGCIYIGPRDDEYCNKKVLPLKSQVLRCKRDGTPYIESISSLYKLINASGAKIKMFNDGATITVIDKGLDEEKRFSKKASLVRHLVDSRGFDKTAVDKLLSDGEVLVLNKHAFIEPAQREESMASDQQPIQPFMGATAIPSQNQAQAPGPISTPQTNEIDEEVLQSTAELGDQELMDTGLLASVAGEEDLKVVMVDMLPNFTDTASKLGHIILVLVLNKKELEDFYGREQYQTLLSNIRKVFKKLGKIIADLRKYINMN